MNTFNTFFTCRFFKCTACDWSRVRTSNVSYGCRTNSQLHRTYRNVAMWIFVKHIFSLPFSCNFNPIEQIARQPCEVFGQSYDNRTNSSDSLMAAKRIRLTVLWQPCEFARQSCGSRTVATTYSSDSLMATVQIRMTAVYQVLRVFEQWTPQSCRSANSSYDSRTNSCDNWASIDPTMCTPLVFTDAECSPLSIIFMTFLLFSMSASLLIKLNVH